MKQMNGGLSITAEVTTAEATKNEGGIKLAAASRAIGEAAWREGIDSSGPLGVFVGAMQQALLIMAQTADQQCSGVVRALADARAMTEAEVVKAQQSNRLAVAAIEQAKTAQAGFEVQREKLITKLVDTIVPQMVKAVGEAIVIREYRYNQRVQWGRAFAIAMLAGALLLGGFIWGARKSDAMDMQTALAIERVHACEARPLRVVGSAELYCSLSALRAPVKTIDSQ